MVLYYYYYFINNYSTELQATTVPTSLVGDLDHGSRVAELVKLHPTPTTHEPDV